MKDVSWDVGRGKRRSHQGEGLENWFQKGERETIGKSWGERSRVNK